MPIFFKIPIEKNNLDCSSLKDWEKARNDIIDALGDKKNATIQVEDDHAMTSEGVAIETSYDAKSSSDYSTI